MPSRLLRPALASVVLLLAMPAAAAAAGASLRAPADGVVTGAAPLEVRLRTDPGDRVDLIEVSLRRPGGEVEGADRHLLCDDPGVCSREDRVYRLEFDPNTGAPFVDAADARPLPNGDYVLRLHLTRPGGAVAETLDLALTLSAPGRAAADIAAHADGSEVTISWGPASEPDISGYLVERLGADGWITLAELSPETSSTVDQPPSGHHAYRVVTLRPDGRGATYETASREVTVEVADPNGPDVDRDAPAGPASTEVAPGDDRADGGAPGQEPAPRSPAPAPRDGGAAAASPTAEEPQPETSATDEVPRTESETDTQSPLLSRSEAGEWAVTDASSDPRPVAASPARYAVPVTVALVFVGFCVRTWRWSRHQAPSRR